MPVPSKPLTKLGFLTIGLFDSADPRRGHESTLDIIGLGEQLGFDSAWVRHRHLQYGISSPIAILSRSSRCYGAAVRASRPRAAVFRRRRPSIFGGELTLNTFGDSHATEDPAEMDKIMHGQVETPSGLVLMAADTPKPMNVTVGDNISVSLSGEDEAELRGYWDKLSDGATITMPIDQAPWGDIFGMLIDKFGISWLVNIVGAKQ